MHTYRLNTHVHRVLLRGMMKHTACSLSTIAVTFCTRIDRLNTHVHFLSLLQAGLNPSGEGSATRVLRLHSALFPTSIRSSHKSSMLYFTTSIHRFLCLPLLRCPCTSASKILLTQSSSSRRCTCPNHLNLASRTLSVMHATSRMRRMSSLLFLSLKVRPRIQ